MKGSERGPFEACVAPRWSWLPMAYWFVYVARCSDDTLYVGVARDVTARIAQHDAGKGARYTRGRGPLRVLATKRCTSHGDALRLELALKRLPRARKLSVAATPQAIRRFARSSVKRG